MVDSLETSKKTVSRPSVAKMIAKANCECGNTAEIRFSKHKNTITSSEFLMGYDDFKRMVTESSETMLTILCNCGRNVEFKRDAVTFED